MQQHTLDRLTAPEQALLYLLAVHGPDYRNGLLGNLRLMNIRLNASRPLQQAELDTLLKTLEDARWILDKDGLKQLNAELKNTVLLQLAQRSDCMPQLLSLRQCEPPTWSGLNFQGPFWLALLGHDPENIAQHIDSWAFAQERVTEQPARQLLRNAAGEALLATLDRHTLKLLLAHALMGADALLHDDTAVYRYAVERLGASATTDPEFDFYLGLQAIWRGELDVFQRLYPEGKAPLVLAWLVALLQGRPSEAMQLYQSSLERYRTETRKRKVVLPPLINQLAILTLMANHDPAHHPDLRRMIQQGINGHYGPSYLVLSDLLEQLEGTGRAGDPPGGVRLFGREGWVIALAVYWQGGSVTGTHWQAKLEAFANALGQLGYFTLQQEINALIDAQFATARTDTAWAGRSGFKPVFKLYQRQEAWQHALSALTQLKSVPTAARPDNSTRMAWLITLHYGNVMLEPREQKQNTKGQWGKGRPVALKRLFEESGSFDYLLEQDKQVLHQIRLSHDYGYYGSSQYELDGEAALPALAGHPALFWADSPDVRIDLTLGQVALQLKSANGQIELKLTPARIGTQPGVVWEKETPTRLVVYPVSADLARIAGIVGKGLAVPEAAKAQLMEAISSIAPLLPIHSDMQELSPDIPSVEANSKLYAHLLPLEAGLRLQFLVQPLPGGGWYAPGRGSEALMGELDGQPVQTRRQLMTEKAELERILAACPALADAEFNEHEWQLSEPQQALEALSELRALDAQSLECVWPEGERMRIKGRRGLPAMRFNLKRKGDWFELTSELTLDDGQVLQLRQLLQLIKENKGRFIKLGDQDWLALDDSLRKRLEQLSLLAEPAGKNGVRLNALAAPFLAELADDAGEFDGDAAWQEQRTRLESLHAWHPKVPSTLQAELRDYQREGYIWLSRLAHWGVGACLADDMGLGKTVQTLALLLERAPGGPQLVIAPTSVAMNWLDETARFAPTLRVRAYHQERDLSGLGPFDLVVASYGLLQQESGTFAAQHWHSVVLDEAQAIKNAQTKRSQAAMALDADFRMAASGTPLENHLGELWNLFRFINPGLLGSQEQFKQRFATPIEQGEAEVRKALKTLIRPFILRRNKSQVLDELPQRTEMTHLVSLSREERHWYEALRQEALKKLEEQQGADNKPLQVLAEITRLRRFCCHPSLALENSTLPGSKLAACAEIIDELLGNRHKALVFSQFVDHLAIVRHYLDEQNIRYQYLDGATPPKERKARVDAFQSGEGDIFLISLKAGGTGLNLTAADYVIHLDPWWNPAVEDQASDRAHRMGQKRPVTIYRLVAQDTIEEQIVALHAKKRDLADSLLEGGEVSAKLDAEALLALLRGE